MAVDGTGGIPRPKKVRVREKGQFTIPVDFRNRIGIDSDTIVEVYQVGRAIVVTPAEPTVSKLAREVEEKLSQAEYSLGDLLLELREGTHEYRGDD